MGGYFHRDNALGLSRVPKVKAAVVLLHMRWRLKKATSTTTGLLGKKHTEYSMYRALIKEKEWPGEENYVRMEAAGNEKNKLACRRTMQRELA